MNEFEIEKKEETPNPEEIVEESIILEPAATEEASAKDAAPEEAAEREASRSLRMVPLKSQAMCV